MIILRNEKGQFVKGAGFIDITGQRFGKLTAIKLDKLVNKKSYWTFRCDCGKSYTARVDCVKEAIRKGRVPSCGCWASEQRSKLAYKNFHSNDEHNESRTRFYKEYISAKSRVNSTREPLRKWYLDKGIKFEWQSYLDFKNDMYESYLKHVSIYGEQNTTIDRIDTNGNYCKDNCRWATVQVQNNNRTSCVKVLFDDGSSMTLKEYSKTVNIPYATLVSRKRNSVYNKSKEIPVSALIKQKDDSEVNE